MSAVVAAARSAPTAARPGGWARVTGWLWEDAPDRRYLVVRRGLAGVMALRLAAGGYWEVVRQPEAQMRPPGFLQWMSSYPPAGLLVAVQAVGVVLALVAASGWGVTTRPGPRSAGVARLQVVAAAAAYPLAWLAYLYLTGVKTSGGKVLHNDVLLLLVAFPPALVAENRRVGPRGGPTRLAGPRRNVGWPLHLGLLLLVLAYFLAGVAKLVHSGPEWVFSDNVRYVMYWAAQTDAVPSGVQWIASIPANSPLLARVVAGTTIVFEVGAPAVLVWRRLRPWYALLAVVLHVGTWVTIGLDYWGWSLTALVVLVDWGQTEGRRPVPGSQAVAGTDRDRAAVVAREGAGVEGVLVYDGDCGFCSRTAAWVGRRAGGRAVVRPWHATDLEALGLTEEQVTAEVWWVDRDGSAHGGHRAVALALWVVGGPWVPVARALLLPGVRFVAAPAYRWVARHRHRLPGGGDACRVGGR